MAREDEKSRICSELNLTGIHAGRNVQSHVASSQLDDVTALRVADFHDNGARDCHQQLMTESMHVTSPHRTVGNISHRKDSTDLERNRGADLTDIKSAAPIDEGRQFDHGIAGVHVRTHRASAAATRSTSPSVNEGRQGTVSTCSLQASVTGRLGHG